MSKQGEAWMCTNEALWLLGVGFVPKKGSTIEPKSNMDGSETAQGRLEERIRNAQDNSRRCIWWSYSTMVGPMSSPYGGGQREPRARRCRCSRCSPRVNLDFLDFSVHTAVPEGDCARNNDRCEVRVHGARPYRRIYT